MNIRSLPRTETLPRRPDPVDALRIARDAVDAEDRDIEAAEAEARRAEAERDAADEAARDASARAFAAQAEAVEALARIRDADADRMAYAIAIVQCAEAQKGRFIPSRKGAQTIVLIKRLLDALHDDDAPVVYPQFEPGALGGRSKLDMAGIEAAITGERAPDDARAPRPNAAHSPGDEGSRESAASDGDETRAPGDAP